MAIDNLFPYAGNNAIQNVVFAIEWAEQLETSELHIIRGLHESPVNREFRKTFPQVQEPRMLMIKINQDSAGQSVRSNNVDELGGVNFVRPSVNTVGAASKALNVSRQSCMAVISEYTRWDLVWLEVRNWLILVMPTILKKRPVTTFGLQYTDVFQWKADPASLVVSEVLSKNSDYLPKNVFDSKSLWHSHHGFLKKEQAPIPHDLLENVNVNMLENNGQRSIQIVTSHRVTLATPSWKVDEPLDQLMPSLHLRNKAIIGNLLTPAVQATIKLNG